MLLPIRTLAVILSGACIISTWPHPAYAAAVTRGFKSSIPAWRSPGGLSHRNNAIGLISLAQLGGMKIGAALGSMERLKDIPMRGDDVGKIAAVLNLSDTFGADVTQAIAEDNKLALQILARQVDHEVHAVRPEVLKKMKGRAAQITGAIQNEGYQSSSIDDAIDEVGHFVSIADVEGADIVNGLNELWNREQARRNVMDSAEQMAKALDSSGKVVAAEELGDLIPEILMDSGEHGDGLSRTLRKLDAMTGDANDVRAKADVRSGWVARLLPNDLSDTKVKPVREALTWMVGKAVVEAGQPGAIVKVGNTHRPLPRARDLFDLYESFIEKYGLGDSHELYAWISTGLGGMREQVKTREQAEAMYWIQHRLYGIWKNNVRPKSLAGANLAGDFEQWRKLRGRFALRLIEQLGMTGLTLGMSALLPVYLGIWNWIAQGALLSPGVYWTLSGVWMLLWLTLNLSYSSTLRAKAARRALRIREEEEQTFKERLFAADEYALLFNLMAYSPQLGYWQVQAGRKNDFKYAIERRPAFKEFIETLPMGPSISPWIFFYAIAEELRVAGMTWWTLLRLHSGKSIPLLFFFYAIADEVKETSMAWWKILSNHWS